MFRDFGNAHVAGAGWPASAPPSSPCGLSAVSQNSPSCLACSLAVVALPPRGLAAVGTAFRRPCGTVRPSDSSRPFDISSFRSRRLPLVVSHCGGREVSPGKNAELRTDSVATTRARPTDIGLHRWTPVRPRDTRLTALRFRSVRCCTLDFHQTPPRGTPGSRPSQRRCSGSVPLSHRCGVPSVRVPEGLGSARIEHLLTFCSAPMPGAHPGRAVRVPDAGFYFRIGEKKLSF